MASEAALAGLPAGSTVLGYPRIGANRELKKAIEGYWRNETETSALAEVAAQLRQRHWQSLREAGISQVPCNDFSFYDHVLDTAVMVGAIPPRHRDASSGAPGSLDRYFAMARGTEHAAPLEMTKWFDTNYHYLVPELEPGTRFELDAAKPLGELRQARALGLDARPVFVGPLTFLLLSKAAADAPSDFEPLQLVDELLAVYVELLRLLHHDASWVQLDEPALVCDGPPQTLRLARYVYEALGGVIGRPNILLATYFDELGDALPILREIPVEGAALDFRGPASANLTRLEDIGGLPGKRLVAGVVDGRNVWVNDLRRSLDVLHQLQPLADEIVVAPSCSLLHVPFDVDVESELDETVRPWLSFAKQKVGETAVLARALAEGEEAVAADLERNRAILADRAGSSLVSDPAVRAVAAEVRPADFERAVAYAARAEEQARVLRLPPLPTTTIGSFPQTATVRDARAKLRQQAITQSAYLTAMRSEISHAIAIQEEAGLDVLVHGEPERADMVQYFADQLSGVLSTAHGWVQSYGTRCVRPPIIYGDVARPAPMTVEWFRYAQALTSRPVKGMLTGPVTMLRWSFVRDDLPAKDVATQMALALRDEILDLEAAGATIIQVDEPALREGLPLRRARRLEYLRWAVDAFRLATSRVRATTQIHTHMCYAEFGDVIEAIIDLDADVISLEAARSGMTIVDELADAGYPAAVGPGVYDIHSPRIPSVRDMTTLIGRALRRLPADRLWVNPDCGLKTRGEAEVLPALRNLVAAARQMREGLGREAAVVSGTSDAPATAKCSAKGCVAEASWVLVWNNPAIHAPDREKMWAACDAHKASLASFLSSRSFLRRVDALQRA